MKRRRTSMPAMGAILCLLPGAAVADPLGTAFTYQGQLKQDGKPVNAACEFEFTLWSADSGGDPIGDPVTLTVPENEMVNGLFSVKLNQAGEFGPDAFNGDRRWLEISVSCPPGGTLVLLGRQELTPAPYALRAATGSGDGSLWQLNGTDVYYTNGNVGIGTPTPQATLDLNGSMIHRGFTFLHKGADFVIAHDARGDGGRALVHLGDGTDETLVINFANDFNLGTRFHGRVQVQDSIRLDAADRPMIVRQWDPMTSGRLEGFGRWGMFMEPSTLVIGIPGPDLRRSLRISGWNLDGTREDLLTVDNNGNVGIGTTIPGATLHVSSTHNPNLRITQTSDTDWARLHLDANGNGFTFVVGAPGTPVPDVLHIWHKGVGNILSVTGTGKVGIGTDDPDQPLHVVGNALFENIRSMELVGPSGLNKIRLVAETATGQLTSLTLLNRFGEIAAWMYADSRGDGKLILQDGNGVAKIRLDSNHIVGEGASLQLMDRNGQATIKLFAEAVDGTGGAGRIVTPILEITGGADLSEHFEVIAGKEEPEPGQVVCIDARNPGKLVVCNEAYDSTVAGIISGAGGIQSGMIMGQAGSIADGKQPVALSGRVYVWADASNGPIQPGDLLTTSDTLGHAMKVGEYSKAQGAILGKAMTGLGTGKALVLVLVSLQ